MTIATSVVAYMFTRTWLSLLSVANTRNRTQRVSRSNDVFYGKVHGRRP